MEIMVSPLAIEYLKEALCNVFWYKNNLKSFLLNCVYNKSIVNNANWENYKRQIVSDVIDDLCENQEKYLGDIRRLLSEVSKMDNFRHLEQLEDGRRKAERARTAVNDLKRIIEDHDQKTREEEEIRRKRKENMDKIRASQAVLSRLDTIKTEYFKLVSSKNLQSRGFDLEKVLFDIFELFDLDPKASFRNLGEQIDGAFSLEGTDYLFEAKWHKQPIDSAELDAFVGKINRKLDNTLGLFLSINGFSEGAIRNHSSGRSTIILMDGMDLMSVLENQIDFVSLIVRKRRHAAHTGNIYLTANEIINE